MKTLAAIRSIDLRVWIIGALLAALCANFWIGSRYPSLQGKASADPNEALSTPLGFDRHFPEPPATDTGKHIVWSACEWAVTNQQGMTFGLLLAAGLLTLVPLLPRPRGGKFAGSVQGMLIGTPLGVCVNCAAPIGQAMLRGGSRVEVALAAMFTSPSFNVIVVGMLFTMFPLHLALLKLVSSALMVLVVVPRLSVLADRPGWRHPPREPGRLAGLRVFQWLQGSFDAASRALLVQDTRQPRGALGALGWVLMIYPRNLLTVLLIALPLMALAGLIGAALVELLPWSQIIALSQLSGWQANLAVLLAVTAFGVLLPIPIAFDVVICSVLWNAGVPPYIVASLLVTLGLYSIYPWSLIGTTLSWRVAAVAGAAVFALGIIAGGAAGLLDRWHDIHEATAAASRLAQLPAPGSTPRLLPTGRSAQELAGVAAPLPAMQRVTSRGALELWSAPFAAPAAAKAPQPFSRVDGPQAGFERLPLPRAYQQMEPTIMHLGGLAAGDVDHDGWTDLAMGSYSGVYLYRNLGGHFALQQIDFPAMRDWVISDLALVDLDGDGAPDLFFCAWMQGCHILFNRGGAFSGAAHEMLPRLTETVVDAAAFADVDRDGDLDIVTGGATSAAWFFYPKNAVNRLWRNDGHGHFTPEALAGPEGDTLTLLFTDLNHDGWPDLIAGNDFDEPDRVFLNDHGKLMPVKAKDSTLPYSTTTTMSLDTGDLDNDGKPELYITQIAMGSMSGLAKRLAAPLKSCDVNGDIADRSRCDELAGYQVAVVRARNVEDVSICDELANPAQRRDCVVTAYHWNRIIVKLPVLGAGSAEIAAECAKIPLDYSTMKDLCADMANSPLDYNQSARDYPGELEQKSRTNLLLAPGASGYADATKSWNASFGGWSWNGKFADLDNDGWQDIFVAQGSRLRASSAWGVYYHNEQGKTLKESTRDSGLEDHRPTGAYLALDYDNDGDLDLITYPFMLTPTIWRNDAPAGPGFELALDDERSANHAAIGARVEIRSADGRQQMREVKGSGGYQSHDAPVARFGLGDWKSVASVQVTWPDGTVDELRGEPLLAGRYRLVRKAG